MGAGRSIGRHSNCGKNAALFGALTYPALAEHFRVIGGENASARAGMVATSSDGSGAARAEGGDLRCTSVPGARFEIRFASDENEEFRLAAECSKPLNDMRTGRQSQA